MGKLLASQDIENLAILIEEATRSTEEGVKRFIEPSPGALRRATSKRHHIIFGRRGSGKSSLLRKAAEDLTIDRRPIAYVDLETFKGHNYPNVLLSVLIKSFEEFAEWLDTAAVNSANKTSFWKKLFGTQPKRPPFNRKEANELSSALRKKVAELNQQLHVADNIETHRTTKNDQEEANQDEIGIQIGLNQLGISSKLVDSAKINTSEEIQEAFYQSKTDFLHRHILEYQRLFNQISKLSGGDAYLFLDDLYHIRRSDQARVIDYFHSIAKGNNLWLKIGTIRHRSRWYIHSDPPIGVKLGDDADEIDLDLTLEKYISAKEFLKKILAGFMQSCGSISTKEILVDEAMDRLVLASGGVARDFLGIFRRSIGIAREREHRKNPRGPKIGIEDVNAAAGEYDTTKREEFKKDTLDDRSELEEMFQRIVAFCTDQVKTNVFLLDKDLTGKNVESIQELVDLRLLHKVRDRVTVKSGQAGKIFEAYMLDVSQYTGSRKRRGLDIIEFRRPDHSEKLRRTTLIYDTSGASKTNSSASGASKTNSSASGASKVVQDSLFP
ncbi:MAG: hypothetical protein AUH89_00170 [Ktedonobacter sp. 13_1_40CM_4_52_4]|nr:MAG: hypothetical protein AUH89_00170 [Ktedonobacter sp. 13_1_40CM_4_52_4]